jgi:hypothetical protein
MKKTLLFISIIFACINAAKAQYYYIPFTSPGINPGNINSDAEYPSGGGLPVGWVTVLGASNTAPNWSSIQTLPFAFSFNGAAVTQFKVSSSGVLTFSAHTSMAAPSYTKAALPSASIPDSSVCIWGLGGLGSNDNIVSKTFGTSPNRQFWIQFSSYGYGSTASDGTNFCYWSIVIEETTNNIYLVDNRTGGYATAKNVSAGIQVNSSTAYTVATSPNLTSLAGADPTPVDNVYYQFLFGTQPAYDLSVTNITTPTYVALAATAITGDIFNLGTATITSLDINYSVNGGTAVTSTLNGLNIAPLTHYSFTHPTNWTPAGVGIYTIAAKATNINITNVDANPSNDYYTKTINVLSELVQRVPLYEVFTSSTCPPCAPGNTNFHNILDTVNQSNFCYIKFQQDFPSTGDPYATAESVNRRAYYSISSIPRMEIDGGWDGNANSFTYQLYQDSRSIPANYKINGTFYMDTVNKSYSVKVRYSPLFNASTDKLYIGIIEKVTQKNVKTNGETKFINVMKKMVPNENGTTIGTLAAGTWDSLSVSYTFNGNYRLPSDGQTANVINNATENSVEHWKNLSFVAWIQSPTKLVHNSNYPKNLTPADPAGMFELVKSIDNINVYPNPVSNVLSMGINMNMTDNAVITLVDEKGATYENKNVNLIQGKNVLEFDVTKLPSGIYNISLIDSHQNSFTRSIVVNH